VSYHHILTQSQMIIVGAGPTGLILGLLRAKQGIYVDLLDAGAILDKQPRAAHYASPAAYDLDRAGVLDDVTARGINHKKMVWRKIDTEAVATLPLDRMPRSANNIRWLCFHWVNWERFCMSICSDNLRQE